MPKKKVAANGDIQIHIRLKPADAAAIDKDRKALPGVPVGRVAYARHAVLSYPKLRKLEEAARSMALLGNDKAVAALNLLEEAGL